MRQMKDITDYIDYDFHTPNDKDVLEYLEQYFVIASDSWQQDAPYITPWEDHLYTTYSRWGKFIPTEGFKQLIGMTAKKEGTVVNKDIREGYQLADGTWSSEYSIGDKFIVVDVKGGQPHYCFNAGAIITFTEEDNSDSPYFDDDNAVKWHRLKAYKPQFTKSSLKDGMVVEYRNGMERIVFGDKLISDNHFGKCLSEYDGDLLNTAASGCNLDIVKVSYMSELLWQREEDPTPAQLKKQRITKELEFAEAKRERLNAHIERLKANLAD